MTGQRLDSIQRTFAMITGFYCTDSLLQALAYKLPVLLNTCEQKGVNIECVTRKQLAELFLRQLAVYSDSWFSVFFMYILA